MHPKYKSLKPFLTSSLLLSAVGGASLNAQDVLVTIAEDSGQQYSTLSGFSSISFDDMSNGNYYNQTWTGIGTFDAMMVHQGGTVFGA